MQPLAVYVHWPYCTRICPYCDFNVYKGGESPALVEAIIEDLNKWRERTGARRLQSLHFGGGTPSLLRPADLEKIIDAVHDLWHFWAGAEIGIEVNPQDAGPDIFKDYDAAGINRISLGIQSFNDQALKLLGRFHNCEEAIHAVRLARKNFKNVSADLIFGWRGQTESDLLADLDMALELDVAHISAYQLTIEPGTAFERAESRGNRKRVDEEKSADLMSIIPPRLGPEGFHHYEVSNFGKTSFESQHNLAYWQGHDYVGVGPGAHGRLTDRNKRWATETYLKPDAYIRAVQNHGSGLEANDRLESQDWADEYVMMGLRIKQGISLERYEQIAGKSLCSSTTKSLLGDKLLKIKDGRMFATDKGRSVLDYVTRKLLT